LSSLHHVFFFKLIANDPDMARSPPGSYEQNWPPTNPGDFSSTDKPPFLPPHLLNIILNKDTAAHVKQFFFSLKKRIFLSYSLNQLYYQNQIMLC
jgi:hypothetical protein